MDGFVGLETEDDPGFVITKPFRLEGSKLEINVDARDGELGVEVSDALQSGTPIPGFTASDALVSRNVDDLRLHPRWKDNADLAALRGKVVRLKFGLRNAKLYSFQVQA